MILLDDNINQHNGSVGEDLEANAFHVQAWWLPELKHTHLTYLYKDTLVVYMVQIQMEIIKTIYK